MFSVRVKSVVLLFEPLDTYGSKVGTQSAPSCSGNQVLLWVLRALRTGPIFVEAFYLERPQSCPTFALCQKPDTGLKILGLRTNKETKAQLACQNQMVPTHCHCRYS